MYRKLAFLFPALLLVGLASAGQKPASSKQEAGRPSSKSAAPAAEKNPAGLPSEATVKAFLQHTIGVDPNLNFKVAEIKPAKAAGLAEVDAIISTPQGAQNFKFFVTEDQKFAIAGELFPFGPDPFGSIRRELGRRENGVARGPQNAPLTLVEFSDLQCPACKQAQPTLEKLVVEMPNVRFVWQQFPLPMHPWAFKAASYGDCLGRSNSAAYWKFVDAVFSDQQQITPANADDKLKEAVTKAGADASAVAACAAQPATAERVNQSVQLGKDVDVAGTPTLFVGGRKVGNLAGMPYETLKQVVEYQSKQAEATQKK